MIDFVWRLILLGADMPDVALNETENVVLTNSCVDIDWVAVAQAVLLPTTSISSCNSNGLSSKEANAICLVLVEISPLLQRYDSGKTIFQRLQKEKINDSINFTDDLLNTQSILQQQVIGKLSDLRREFVCWERSVLIKNDLCAPINCAFTDNGTNLLRNWDISFYQGNKSVMSIFTCFITF